MRIEKIKEILNSKRAILKNKKVMAVSGAVAGALIIAIAGATILYNNFAEDSKVLVDKQYSDNVIEDENVDKNEELTLEDINENEEVVQDSDNHVHDENCNHDNENSTSQEKSTTENNSNKSNVENIAENKESNSSSNSTSNNTSNTTSNNNINNSNSNKNENNTSNNNSNKNEHTHTWVEVYKDVSHAEEGHWENVLVKDAWTESVPVYEQKELSICNTCGADITGNTSAHMREHMLNGENGSFRTEWKQVQVGTNTITHDAVYEKKWIVDKAAWTEKVLSGYKCSSCGATK